MHPYIEYVNPHLGKMLTEIGLDKRFVRGNGCLLYDEKGIEYLDCIAAYGALPFGYNPPEIWEAIQELHTNQEPSFIQPSLLEAAGELGKRLIEAAPSGMAHVTFANSGAEAVEAAFKLCRAKTGRKLIISTRNSFHGKTLGALSATGNKGYQEAFGAPVPHFAHIQYGEIEALKAFLEKRGHEAAAFIVEPIQGEGGIVEPPSGYLKQVQELCQEWGVLTIFDEIQTGLGRTGRMFACEREGVTPDVMVVAKALGGGIVPIGAVLCKADVYTEDFGMKHSSTFAGNSLGCRVGIRVMDLLTQNDNSLLEDVRRKGELLKGKLLDIAERYPHIIKKVRGQGFMLGIEFGSDKEIYPHSLLGVMAEQEILTPMISSFLLNTERVRVAPTLNGASVIRIEPPLIMTEEQIERAVGAIERTVHMLAQRNTASFLGHLIGYKAPAGSDRSSDQIQIKDSAVKPQPDDGRFAFLVHPVNLGNYSDFDNSLTVFSEEQLLDLSSRWNDMVEPFVVGGTRITNALGNTAYGEFVCVPRTADQLLAMDREQAVSEITAAVDLAVQRGAKIVGLGAYTSVVTMGGRFLLPYTDVALTTGNSYTVVSGVEALLTAGKRIGMDLNHVTAAVVGAGGAIGKASALLLSEEVQSLILIGNPKRPAKSEYRMLKVAVEIIQHLRDWYEQGKRFAPGTLGAFVSELSELPSRDSELKIWIEYVKELIHKGAPITITVESEKYLPQADVILAATSSPDALIKPDMLKWGALICDMSRPLNVSQEVLERRPDVLVIDGGVIEVPNCPDLGWNFGFEVGSAYACMSETMMLALEKRYENVSIGADLNLDFLQEMRRLADKQGFRLAGFRSFDSPLDESVWERVKRLQQERPISEDA